MEKMENVKVIIDVDLNRDESRIFGWYLYARIERDGNTEVTSRYCSDSQIVVILIPGIREYRKLLKDNGANVLANDRTCFSDEHTARSLIPILEKLINRDMLF